MLAKKEILPLSVFIRRSHVLKLYKDIFRITKRLKDDQVRASLMNEARVSFKANKAVTDAIVIKSCLVEAERSLQRLRTLASNDNVNNVDKVVGHGWPWEL